MPVVIGVPREIAADEKRLAVVPDVVRTFKSQGAQIMIEAGAGAGAYFADGDFADATVVGSAAELYAQAHVVLKVRPPTLDEINLMQPGTVLVGFLQPYQDAERAKALAVKKITSFAVELIPRI